MEEVIVEDYLHPEDAVLESEIDAEEHAESQIDMQDSYAESPQYSSKDDLFTLFWKVVKTPDSTKVGNLEGDELGMLDISVRDCQSIALLATSLGHKGFAKFFSAKAEIILSTSMSREGALTNLFVTQQRYSVKARGLPKMSRHLTLREQIMQENVAKQNDGAGNKPRKGLFGR